MTAPCPDCAGWGLVILRAPDGTVRASYPCRCGAGRCDLCGCLLGDHREPDWYDPRTEEAYGEGRLNRCLECGECYAD